MKKIILIITVLNPVILFSQISEQTYFGIAGENDAPHVMCSLPDGNIVLAGLTYADTSFTLTKLNPQGDIIFFKSFKKSAGIFGSGSWYDLFFTSTGKLLLSGMLYGTDANYAPHPVTLVMFDTLGTVLWNKVMGSTYWDEQGGNVTEVSPGNYALTVHSGGPQDSTSGTCVVLFNETGTINAARCFTQNVYFGCAQLTSLPNGNLLLIGGTQFPFNPDFDYEAVMMELDGNLNLQWAKTYLGPHTRFFDLLVQTDDGGIVTASWVNDLGSTIFDILLLKTNDSGVVQWAKRFSNPGNRLFIRNISLAADGGFFITGTFLHQGVSNYDGFLIRTDDSGDLLWSRIYGDSVGTTTNFESIIGVVESGNQLIMTGNSNFGGSTDFMFVSADDAGLASSCYQHDADISAVDVTSSVYDSVIVISDSVVSKSFYSYTFTNADVVASGADFCPVGMSTTPAPSVFLENPVIDRLIFSIEGLTVNGGRATICDLSGRTLLKEEFANLPASIHCEMLSSGIYLLRVTSREISVAQKFVKQ